MGGGADKDLRIQLASSVMFLTSSVCMNAYEIYDLTITSKCTLEIVGFINRIWGLILFIIKRIIHKLIVHSRSAHKIFEFQISQNRLSFNITSFQNYITIILLLILK